jgi:hypothetical protein
VNSELGQQRGSEVLGDVGQSARRRGDTARGAGDQDTGREQRLVAAGPASAGSAGACAGRLGRAEEGDGFELASEFIVGGGATHRGEDLRERLIARRHHLDVCAVEELFDNRVIEGVRIVTEPLRREVTHLTIARP